MVCVSNLILANEGNLGDSLFLESLILIMTIFLMIYAYKGLQRLFKLSLDILTTIIFLYHLINIIIDMGIFSRKVV